MIRFALLLIGIAALSGSAVAQTSRPATSPGSPAATGTPPAASSDKPLDNGPFTPDASRAFHGGGVVLQGAPGAPAPAPQALPPETSAPAAR